jgi:hypothetical protein
MLQRTVEFPGKCPDAEMQRDRTSQLAVGVSTPVCYGRTKPESRHWASWRRMVTKLGGTVM